MAKRSRTLYTAYREPKYSRSAVTAFVLGLVSLVIMIGVVLWSTLTGGKAALTAGALGLCGFLISAAGLVTGFKSFREQSRSYLLSKVGSILSSLLLAAWFLLICVGLT